MRQLLLSFLCFLPFVAVFSQTEEDRKVEFGIILSTDLSILQIQPSNWTDVGIENDIHSMDAVQRIGPSLGILSMIKLSDRLTLSPQLILMLRDSRINFDIDEEGLYTETIAPVTASIPLHLVYSILSTKGPKPSFVFGVRNNFNFTRNIDEQKLVINKHNVGLDVGFGVEFQLSKFKLKPDLIYSHGLNNINTDNSNIYNQAIRSVHQNSLSLRLLFYN